MNAILKHAFKGWGLENPDRPLIIAGPCSAESEEQVLDTARQLKAMNVWPPVFPVSWKSWTFPTPAPVF